MYSDYFSAEIKNLFSPKSSKNELSLPYSFFLGFCSLIKHFQEFSFVLPLQLGILEGSIWVLEVQCRSKCKAFFRIPLKFLQI